MTSQEKESTWTDIYMGRTNLVLTAIIIHLALLLACSQRDDSNHTLIASKMEAPVESKQKPTHPYGGWSCPDNLRGFPPVNIQALNEVPVVNGRLPTKEETQNGRSLLFFDTKELPDARPLDMVMPKLAKYYSEYTGKDELVIVIQAVIVENDTVVGFRYLNGGNGSAWFNEVTLLSQEETDRLSPASFVYFDREIKASKGKIWKIITSPLYTKFLTKVFGENAHWESEWKEHAEVHFKNATDSIVTFGTITALWENLYIQIDYDSTDSNYSEKILLLDNEDPNSVQLHFVSGPYGGDFETQKEVWSEWLRKVKELSEQG